MNRDEAVQILNQWVTNSSLLRHSLAVEQVMRCAAAKYGGLTDNPEKWALAGLLHDADWELFPEDHPHRIVQLLWEAGEEEVAYAISSHGAYWGIPHRTPMDKALVASDELTGLVVACALLRLDGILTLEKESVVKKFRTAKFAAGVDRMEIEAGVQILGVSLSDHIDFVIDALRQNAAELGLNPR